MAAFPRTYVFDGGYQIPKPPTRAYSIVGFNEARDITSTPNKLPLYHVEGIEAAHLHALTAEPKSYPHQEPETRLVNQWLCCKCSRLCSIALCLQGSIACTTPTRQHTPTLVGMAVTLVPECHAHYPTTRHAKYCHTVNTLRELLQQPVILLEHEKKWVAINLLELYLEQLHWELHPLDDDRSLLQLNLYQPPEQTHGRVSIQEATVGLNDNVDVIEEISIVEATKHYLPRMVQGTRVNFIPFRVFALV